MSDTNIPQPPTIFISPNAAVRDYTVDDPNGERLAYVPAARIANLEAKLAAADRLAEAVRAFKILDDEYIIASIKHGNSGEQKATRDDAKEQMISALTPPMAEGHDDDNS